MGYNICTAISGLKVIKLISICKHKKINLKKFFFVNFRVNFINDTSVQNDTKVKI